MRTQYYHRPHIYFWVLLLWSTIMIIFEYFTWRDGIIPTWQRGHPIYAGLIVFNQVFVALFFYFSTQNLILPILYQTDKQKQIDYEDEVLNIKLPANWHPKVLLLYTTYNDFLPYAADQCFHQTYDNCQPIILDNSNHMNYIHIIQEYVKVHPNTIWVHDQNNKHAKAGNLDHYLCNEGKGTYDYFVILDSDELLEPTFVEKALKFFYVSEQDPNSPLGILQANHISGQNQNQFQSLFSASGNSFWPVQNSIRSANSGLLTTKHGKTKRAQYGDTVCIELGHGTMVSAKCFDTVGKIPWVVAEDLCFSFEAIMKGFNIRFAHQIYGNESFPITQTALMVRSNKFCSANFEFFKKYGKRLFKTKLLTRIQKLDLLSFTLSVPLFAFEYFSLILCSIVFPLANINTGEQWFFLAPTLIAYFSQSITDGWFQYHAGWSLWHVLKYEFFSALLYGNMYYETVKSTFLALIGRPAKFNVTPKENDRIKTIDAIKENKSGIIFSLLTIIIVLWISGSAWILMSFIPGIVGFTQFFWANHQSNEDKHVQKVLTKGNQHAYDLDNYNIVPWNI